MTFIHHNDDKIRFLVLYQDVTRKATTIQKYIGISIRTIYDQIDKTEKKCQHIRKSKRSTSIAPNVKTNLVYTMRGNPSKTSVKNLSNQYEIGKTTVHQILTNKNFQYQKVPKTKILIQKELNNRVSFCKDMKNKNGKRIHNSYFADEMGISLSEALEPSQKKS